MFSKLFEKEQVRAVNMLLKYVTFFNAVSLVYIYAILSLTQ